MQLSKNFSDKELTELYEQQIDMVLANTLLEDHMDNLKGYVIMFYKK